MKISILVPSFNQRTELQRTLRALIPEKDDCEILVADRGSTDGTLPFLHSLSWVKLIAAKGYRSEAINAAAEAATGDVLLILSPGSFPSRGWKAALQAAEGKGLDAGYFQVAKQTGIRTQAEQLSQRMLGGPRTTNGVFVMKPTWDTLGGLRPLPEFEWLAFSNRVKSAGGSLGGLPHEILTMAPSGSPHRSSWWADTMEDCFAAWKYVRTDALCPVRARRERTAAVILRQDWDADMSSSTEPSSELGDVYAEAAHQIALCLKTFGGIRIAAVASPTPCPVQERAGFVQIPLVQPSAEGRIQEILAWAERESCEALYVVRPVFPGLSHTLLRELAEQTDGLDAGILPTSRGEWAAFWMETPAPGRLSGWNGSPDAKGLKFALREDASQIHQLSPVQGLYTQQDAKEYFYRGVLSNYS